jgi:tetratricopeptide (TPR) repeat protein
VTELPAYVRDLLDKLASGGNPLELLLSALPVDDGRLLRLCAIPHTFSPPLLPVLDPQLAKAEAAAKYAGLAKLAIVRQVGDRLALHDDARTYLFRSWLEGTTPEFAEVSERLAGYFRRRVDELGADIPGAEEAQLRMVFHLIGADERQGIAEFEHTSRQLRYRLHWAMLERLFGLVDEYAAVLSSTSRTAVQYHRGKLAADLREWETAKTQFEGVIACKATGDDRRLHSRIRLGMVEASRRDWDAAIAVFERTLSELERGSTSAPDREKLVALTLLDLGSAWREKHNYSKAADLIGRGLRRAESHPNTYIQANAYNSRGRLHADLDEREHAIADYRRSLELLEQAGDSLRAADVLNNLGVEYLKSAQWEESRGFFERSLRIKREAEDAAGEARVLNNLARLERRAQAQSRAIALLGRAARLFEEVHDYFSAGVAMRNLARCHRTINEVGAFTEGLEQARKLFEQAGARQEIANIDAELKGLKWPRGCTLSLVIVVGVFALLIVGIIIVAVVKG